MIDLHTHTTASDGRLSPAALVARAAEAGIRTMAVTDHDTTAAVEEARGHAVRAGIALVTGIELTAVHAGRDVHVLGYFFDPAHPPLVRLLETQRAARVARTREIGVRLRGAGAAIDVDAVLAEGGARPGRAVGRPLLARALVAAGHVASVQEAFDKFLAQGRPAFVPREGEAPAGIVRAVHDAGGVASLAHPGVTRQDALIEPLAAAGLDALEVYHTDHTLEMQQAYLALAERLGLLVTGGSDFHGDGNRAAMGAVSLPEPAFAALAHAAALRARP